jgi:hypothetical protein
MRAKTHPAVFGSFQFNWNCRSAYFSAAPFTSTKPTAACSVTEHSEGATCVVLNTRFAIVIFCTPLTVTLNLRGTVDPAFCVFRIPGVWLTGEKNPVALT